MKTIRTIMIICILALTLAGCKTRDRANSVTSLTSATAKTDLNSSDTLRHASDLHFGSIESSVGLDRETTHIHISRDSAGNPTDIHVDKTSTSQGKTKKETSGTAVEVIAAKHQQQSESTALSETTEAKPVKTDDHSAARKAVAWISFCMFLFIIGSLLRRLKK